MMPHYPEDQSKGNLEKVRRNSVCAECGGQVWEHLDLKTKKIYLACRMPGHEGITREYTPPREDYESNIRREIEVEQKHGRETSRELATIPKQGQLTESQAMRILRLVYPDCPDADIVRTAIFCRDFGLHPLAKEVYLIGYNKKDRTGKVIGKEYSMVVGIPASRKMAHNLKGEFSFLEDSPRAANEEEIVKQFGKDSEEEKDNLISICKLEGVGGNLAIGFGLYSKTGTPKGMDKGNSRRNMANIHAERQALDRLPGKPMPHYEVVDEQFIETPSGLVNTVTGEITEPEVVEGEATELPSEPEPAVEPGLFEEDPPHAKLAAQVNKPIIDLDWLRESLKELVDKGQTSYGEESLLGYMRLTFKKVEGETVSKIAEKLDKGQAVHFTKVIQDALNKL